MIYIFIYKINRRTIIDWGVRDSVDTFCAFLIFLLISQFFNFFLYICKLEKGK